MNHPTDKTNKTSEFDAASAVSQHPFVDAIYRWFKRGGLDAATYEVETDEGLSWWVETNKGYRISHHLYISPEDKSVDFQSTVALGQVSKPELEKALNKVAKLNVETPFIYRFFINKDRILLMQIFDSTETISAGSYRSLLEDLIKWADLTYEDLRNEGFRIDRSAEFVIEEKEKKAS